MNRKERRRAQKAGQAAAVGAAAPSMAEIAQLLGAASQAATGGRLRDAERLMARALAVAPQLAETHFVAGQLAEARGDRDAAIARYDEATRRNAAYAPAWTNLGAALRDAGRLPEAIAAYERAVRLQPRSVQALNNLASAEVDAGAFAEAIGHFKAALALEPSSLAVRESLARMYEETKAYTSATAEARRVLEADEGYVDAWVLLGRCLQVLGDFAAAREALDRAIAIDPDHVEANYQLSVMKLSEEEEERILARVERLLDTSSGADINRVPLHFAAGRLKERRKQFDEAFAHYQAGNRMRGDEVGFDADRFRRTVDAVIETYGAGALADAPAAAATQGEGEPVPVFIVGMPRSGTTLTEQIVSSHPLAAGAGELSAMLTIGGEQIEEHEGRIRCALPAEETRSHLRQRYLADLAKGREEARVIADKMPFNFLYLGLIRLVLPQARIIHCRRDPLDTCVSCFTQNFKGRLEFTRELTGLGEYYRQYHRMMAHWRTVMPEQILDLDYEAVTSDPEAAARRIIAFCGLEWDEVCARPHETRRMVATASVWQARQPVYQSSVQRWKRFEAHLEPLKQALGDVVSGAEGG